jgi:hypothetical protein
MPDIDLAAIHAFARKGLAIGEVAQRDFTWTHDSYQRTDPDIKDIEVRIHVGNYMGKIVHREMVKSVHFEDSSQVAQSVLDEYKERLADAPAGPKDRS